MRSMSCLIVAALVLGACRAACGQDLAAAKAEVVRVDVIVTDAQGKVVAGLGREDFEVLEDDKPQKIEDLVFLGGADAAHTTPPAGEGRGRHVAIIVDELHLSRRSVESVRAALLRFLDETSAADDDITLVSVGSPAGIVQPTRDRAAVKQALGHINARGNSVPSGQGAQLTPEQAEQILRGEQAALQLGTRLTADAAGLDFMDRQSAKNDWSAPTALGSDPDNTAAAIDVQTQARSILAQALSRSESTLWTIADVLRSLAPIPGRKLCVLVSDGFLVGKGTSDGRMHEVQQVIDAATRSGTAIYPLVVSGAAPGGDDASGVGSGAPSGLSERVAKVSEQQRLEALEGLANDTGGFVVRGGDGMTAGLARMLQDGESAYLLGYEPANQKRDGRFRKLAIRLPQHPDYLARTRRGYFAPDARKRDAEGKRAARPLPLTAVEAQQALGAPLPANGVPVRLAAGYVGLPPGAAQAVVKVQVDAAGLGWKESAGRERPSSTWSAESSMQAASRVLSSPAGTTPSTWRRPSTRN
jgi:VWFA-related protein